MAPNQQEQERNTHTRSSNQQELERIWTKSAWEARHQAQVQAQIGFPGTRRQQSTNEDRDLADRAAKFCDQSREQGVSTERYVTVEQIAEVEDHNHPGSSCKKITISCSSEALIKKKPANKNVDHSEVEVLFVSNTSSATNEENEVRVK